MASAVIVDVVRTALGKRNGKLKDWHPVDLAAETLKAVVERNDLDPALVGVSAAGVVGGLLAVPVVGAAKAVYLELRPSPAPPAAAAGSR